MIGEVAHRQNVRQVMSAEVVIASDGLWDAATVEETHRLLRKCAKPRSPEIQIARGHLVTHEYPTLVDPHL
jgi:hypothetical protein